MAHLAPLYTAPLSATAQLLTESKWPSNYSLNCWTCCENVLFSSENIAISWCWWVQPYCWHCCTVPTNVYSAVPVAHQVSWLRTAAFWVKLGNTSVQHLKPILGSVSTVDYYRMGFKLRSSNYLRGAQHRMFQGSTNTSAGLTAMTHCLLWSSINDGGRWTVECSVRAPNRLKN